MDFRAVRSRAGICRQRCAVHAATSSWFLQYLWLLECTVLHRATYPCRSVRLRSAPCLNRATATPSDTRRSRGSLFSLLPLTSCCTYCEDQGVEAPGPFHLARKEDMPCNRTTSCQGPCPVRACMSLKSGKTTQESVQMASWRQITPTTTSQHIQPRYRGCRNRRTRCQQPTPTG